MLFRAVRSDIGRWWPTVEAFLRCGSPRPRTEGYNTKIKQTKQIKRTAGGSATTRIINYGYS